MSSQLSYNPLIYKEFISDEYIWLFSTVRIFLGGPVWEHMCVPEVVPEGDMPGSWYEIIPTVMISGLVH